MHKTAWKQHIWNCSNETHWKPVGKCRKFISHHHTGLMLTCWVRYVFWIFAYFYYFFLTNWTFWRRLGEAQTSPGGKGRKKLFLIIIQSIFQVNGGIAWPSGLRRWFKAPVTSVAWVRIPPLSTFSCHCQFRFDNRKHIFLMIRSYSTKSSFCLLLRSKNNFLNLDVKCALSGNRTPVSRVAGENSTTEPTMLALMWKWRRPDIMFWKIYIYIFHDNHVHTYITYVQVEFFLC